MRMIPSQLQNISQTIYCLMTGIYDRRYYHSPYNTLVPNELEPGKGKAYVHFNAIYDYIEILKENWNILFGCVRDYDELDTLLDGIDDLAKELCTNAVSLGYIESLHFPDSNIIQSPYEQFFSINMRTPGGICNKQYKELLKAFKDIKTLCVTLEDYRSIVYLNDLWKEIDREYSILANIAFLHGVSIGKGIYPFWVSETYFN